MTDMVIFLLPGERYLRDITIKVLSLLPGDLVESNALTFLPGKTVPDKENVYGMKQNASRERRILFFLYFSRLTR